jgi:ribosomal protein S21
MRVFVNGDITKAARALKNKLGKDGSLKDLKIRAAHPKKSERRRAKQRQARLRRLKSLKK